ncbi:MAG: hypothetical protein Q4C20_00695 [Erysipelotrichaceae bacterium]|nr:hypothetical protein [Erysipelotrichaceae bacterium]
MQDYKDKVESFRSSARFYLNNKQMYESLTSDPDEKADERQLKYIHDDLVYVEKTLDQIYAQCGSAARLIVYLLYVENRTQDSVAKDYNITRRQLQYSLSKWLRAVFEEAVPN